MVRRVTPGKDEMEPCRTDAKAAATFYTEWLGWTAGQRVTQLLVWVLAGIVIYFVALRVAGLRLLSLWRQEHPS